ncbi:MAG: ABC transporter permease [Saprospiraceae bacterium]|nr:ABC transporter permease [Saprospiraceae bacterium]
MLTNNLKLALRNLSNQKGFAILNILGLAVGVAAVLLIFRMVHYELSFNKNFQHYDRIVRVVTQDVGLDGDESYTRGVPVPAMSVVKNTVSQLAATSKIKEYWPTVLVPNPTGGPALKKFSIAQEKISFFVEPEFFQVFDFQWLTGDKNTALKEPNTLVLTQTMAEKCFGKWENALGQTLIIENDPMTVQGVVADAPVNCDLPISLVLSYSTLLSNKEKYEYNEDWGSTSSNDQMFGLLADASQLQAANNMITQVGQKEYAEQGRGNRSSRQHLLQPLSELHYDDRFGTSATHVISKSRLWVLSSIGFLVLLMACFNFINLSTAQALRRSKEVGVRKALGGSRGNLFGQFMFETALVVLFSLVVGTFLAWAASPLLEQISEVPTELPFLSQPIVLGFLAVLGIVVTLLSGFYPALILAGFNPIQALKNDRSERSTGSGAVRKGLVVFQFMIAQALVVGTIITLGQLDYVRNMDLGFKKDLVYTFGINGDSLSQSKLAGLKQRLLQIPGVESVAFGSDQPASGSTWANNFAFGRGTEDQKFSTTMKFCDADYQKTYGLELVAGRWLEPCDTAKEYVVNETMLKKVGIKNPEEAIGKEVRTGRNRWRPVVGVVKDFHAHSAHRTVEPLMMTTHLKRMYNAGVKITPKNISTTTAAIQKEFDSSYPEQVFDSAFFDESIAEFYIAENRFSATCKGFGLLAIFISCLGLLGLAAHAAQRRTKEIGVRKVLGASIFGITGLLAKDFLKLVIIAIIISSPIAYYFMDKWLADFAYRIDIQWWMFAIAGLGAITVAFITVSFQSVKAALANPVKSLRSE